jgi:hypothetical protein
MVSGIAFSARFLALVYFVRTDTTLEAGPSCPFDTAVTV